MASIRKKATSPYWFACYYREDGSRAQTSTKSTDQRLAQRIADDLEQAHKGRATEGQIRRTLSALNERLTGQPLASATLRDFATQWLGRKRSEVNHLSYSAYKNTVAEFLGALPSKSGLGLQYVTSSDIAGYRDQCSAKTTARTANNKLKIVRTLFQSAWRDGVVQENPATKVQILKTEDAIRRPFSLPELKRLLAVANEEWQGMILVGLYTGQRLKDVATLTWANVDLNQKEIALTSSKTSRRVIVPIAKPLMGYLLKCEISDDPGAPLFSTANTFVEKDGDVGRVSQGFYDLMVSAGLAKKRLGKDKASGVGRSGRRHRSELTFHCLRHTATSLLKNAGVSEAVAMDIIGHDSTAMSQHYTHIETSAKREALDKMPDVLALTRRR